MRGRLRKLYKINLRIERTSTGKERRECEHWWRPSCSAGYRAYCPEVSLRYRPGPAVGVVLSAWVTGPRAVCGVVGSFAGGGERTSGSSDDEENERYFDSKVDACKVSLKASGGKFHATPADRMLPDDTKDDMADTYSTILEH